MMSIAWISGPNCAAFSAPGITSAMEPDLSCECNPLKPGRGAVSRARKLRA